MSSRPPFSSNERPDPPRRRRVSVKLALEACLARMPCAECGLPLKTNADAPVEWDHELPLALGGGHDAGNLRPLHPACHRKKSARDAERIAKAERQAGRVGQQARRRRASGTQLRSRPFQANRSSPLKRRLDGKVVRRRTADDDLDSTSLSDDAT